MVDLSLVTIPPPQPYDDKHPDRQRENFYYVQNQILGIAKANGDPDPFGMLAQRPCISVEVDDISVRTFGEAVIIESF